MAWSGIACNDMRLAGLRGTATSRLLQHAKQTRELPFVQAESAAEQHLGRFSPSLRGRGAIVNVGPFTCRGPALAKLLAAPHTEQLLYDEDLDG